MKSCVVIILSAAPGIILLVPMIYQIYVALGINLASLVAALTALLMGLLVIHLNILAEVNKWLLPVGGALAALCLIGVALFQAGYDHNRPKSDEIFYVLNADSRRAVWASSNKEPDEWTSQFLSENIEKKTLNDYLPRSGRRIYLQAQAHVALLAAPELELLGDSFDNGERMMRLRVTSPRRASKISIHVDKEVADSWINGKRVGPQSSADTAPISNWALHYWTPSPEGIELVLRIKTTETTTIRVVDQSYQLPELAGITIKARPSYIIPAPFSDSDSTIISKSFSFAVRQ